MSASNEQQACIDAPLAGSMHVSACPGSGKTYVLVHRLLWLLDHGAEPESVMMVTFTRAAADEMRQRLREYLPAEVVERRLSIGTVHAVALEIIREHAAELGMDAQQLSVLSDDERDDLVKLLAEADGYYKADKRTWAKGLSLKQVLTTFDEFRKHNITASPAPAFRVWKSYRHAMRTMNLLDYDMILDVVTKQLPGYVHGGRRWAHVLVDEAQDLNAEQWQFICLTGAVVFSVGDPAQSIYGFQGAVGIQPECDRQLTIAKSRRLPIEIADVCSRLIANEAYRSYSRIEGMNGGGSVAWCPGGWGALAAFVATQPREHDVAVMLRTNYLADQVVEALTAYGLNPLRLGAPPVNRDQQRVFRLSLAAMRLRCNPNNDYAAHVIASFYADAGVLATARMEAEALRCSLLEAFRRNQSVRTKTENGSDKYAALSRTLDVVQGRADRVGDFINRLSTVTKQRFPFWREYVPDEVSVGQALEFYAMSQREVVMPEWRGVGRPLVLTMHAAKGLEFDTAIVAGLNEGICPHKRALAEDADGGVDEERRVAYVACTRAKHTLALHWLTGDAQPPSRFLAEMVIEAPTAQPRESVF